MKEEQRAGQGSAGEGKIRGTEERKGGKAGDGQNGHRVFISPSSFLFLRFIVCAWPSCLLAFLPSGLDYAPSPLTGPCHPLFAPGSAFLLHTEVLVHSRLCLAQAQARKPYMTLSILHGTLSKYLHLLARSLARLLVCGAHCTICFPRHCHICVF